jgi:hypothetical protein
MSLAKGTKVWGDAFHLIVPQSTEFMSFKVELCSFCTKTTSSLCVLLQGHPWLCFLWSLGPDPVTLYTASLNPAAHSQMHCTPDPLTPTALRTALDRRMHHG